VNYSEIAPFYRIQQEERPSQATNYEVDYFAIVSYPMPQEERPSQVTNYDKNYFALVLPSSLHGKQLSYL
jgi:hypothetical protein